MASIQKNRGDKSRRVIVALDKKNVSIPSERTLDKKSVPIPSERTLDKKSVPIPNERNLDKNEQV